MEHTGNKLRTELKKKGLKQDDAAEKLGISRTSLHYWLNRPVLNETFLQNVKNKLGIELENSITPQVLEAGFADKLLELIQSGELYPKSFVRKLQNDLAEAQKYAGKMEEQVRLLSEELRKVRG